MSKTDDISSFSENPEAVLTFLNHMQELSARQALNPEAQLRIWIGPPGWTKHVKKVKEKP